MQSVKFFILDSEREEAANGEGGRCMDSGEVLGCRWLLCFGGLGVHRSVCDQFDGEFYVGFLCLWGFWG